nr:DMT family transporter [Streptomyces sp. SBT349]
MPSGVRLDALLLAVALTTVSFSGPLIAATAAPALAIAFWRNALAVAALAPVVALRGRLRAELAAIGRRTLLLSLGSGLALAAHFGLWLPSLHLTSVASSVALVTTTPIWTTLLLRVLGRRPPAAVWLGSAVAFAGVLVLTGVDLSVSSEALAGDALALGGGIAAAGYVLIGAEVRRTTSTTTYTFLCYGTTAAVLLVVCLVAGASLGGGYSGETWLKLVALTATAQFLGHSLINRVVRGLGPSITSTALLLETPGAALIAAVWLGQLPEAAAYPALGLILSGLALVIRAERGGQEDT